MFGHKSRNWAIVATVGISMFMEEKLMMAHHHTLPWSQPVPLWLDTWQHLLLYPECWVLGHCLLSAVLIKCGYKLITLTLTTALGITGPTIQTLPYEHHEDVKQQLLCEYTPQNVSSKTFNSEKTFENSWLYYFHIYHVGCVIQIAAIYSFSGFQKMNKIFNTW